MCEYSTVAVLWHLSDAGEGTVWEYSSCAVLPHRRVVEVVMDGLGLRTTNDELRTDVYLKRVTLNQRPPCLRAGGRRWRVWYGKRCGGGIDVVVVVHLHSCNHSAVGMRRRGWSGVEGHARADADVMVGMVGCSR